LVDYEYLINWNLKMHVFADLVTHEHEHSRIMLAAAQCNVAWNVLTSWNAWNPVTRNRGGICNEYIIPLRSDIFCIYYLYFLLVHTPYLHFEVRCESSIIIKGKFCHHFDSEIPQSKVMHSIINSISDCYSNNF